MMEDKQLNLSRPLLSVRRHTTTVASGKGSKKNAHSSVPSIPRPPPYKSELKSGPVRNPGTVPFIWEQSPGRPKNERMLQTHTERPPFAPKLPPGRVLKANQQDNTNASESLTVDNSRVANHHSSQSVSGLDECGRMYESAEDTAEETEDKNDDSGDEDEVYQDALDALSRTQSFFLNCSVSGISGLDDLDAKHSGTFVNDPQAREFMIGRFLPAAKAMVLETPQCVPAPKKQPLAQESQRLPRKVVNGDNRPQLRYGPSFAKHYSEFHDNGEEESDDDYDDYGSVPTKVCGLLPRFCLKSRLLPPLPGMSVRTRIPPSPATRVQTRSSSASTCSKTENELSSFDMSEQRSLDGSQTTEFHEEKNNLNNKSSQISLASQKFGGSSTSRHSAASGHCYESSASIDQRAFQAIHVESQEARVDSFSSGEKSYRSFRDLLADQSTFEEVDSGSPTVEKTLYIDNVHEDESPKKICSFDIKAVSIPGETNNESFTNRVDRNSLEDYSVIKKFSIADGGDTLQTNFQKPLDFSLPLFADECSQKIRKDTRKDFGEDQNLYQNLVDPKCLEVSTQFLGDQTPKAEKVENFHPPVPPPLPKSPSDSWLCRTLPSMSSKNSSALPHFETGINPRNQASKAKPGDPKWETIVKTSNVHHHHLRYSEELLEPIPEN